MDLRDYIATKPIIEDVSIKKFLGGSASYASLVIHRLQKRGLLKKITRNRYTSGKDINVIATNLYTPSYLSFWSASQYLGYTEQILNTLQIATTKRRKDILFENYRIKFIVLSKKHFFGFRKILTSEGPIFIAEPEKLCIDALLHPKEMGNFDEIIKVLKGAQIDISKMTEYLKAIGNASLSKRIGFLLEKYKGKDISSSLKIKDSNYVSLNPFRKKTHKNIPKWRLRI